MNFNQALNGTFARVSDARSNPVGEINSGSKTRGRYRMMKKYLNEGCKEGKINLPRKLCGKKCKYDIVK